MAFLDTQQAAQYLGLKPKTLEKFRSVGGGPPFRKHGRRVFYAEEDLLGWSDERLRRSTSDPGMSEGRGSSV